MDRLSPLPRATYRDPTRGTMPRAHPFPINRKEFEMNEALQPEELEVVDLGDAKELTKGSLEGAFFEDNEVAPRRPIP
jgi:Family of unknown function (DUF5974)